MIRPEHLLDLLVVVAALIGVADQQCDWRAGGLALEDPGEDLDLIGLLALRDVLRGARFASIQVCLQIGLAQCQTRWTAIDDAADGRTMAFAEAGDREQRAEDIAGHDGKLVP